MNGPTEYGENKRKYLEIIQNTIHRQTNNSFLVRGWTVTLVSLLLVVSADRTRQCDVVFFAILPLLVFWGLDAFYLREERRFRELYRRARETSPEQIDFTMDTFSFNDQVSGFWKTFFAKTLLFFYCSIAITVFVVWGSIAIINLGK